ncbi:MAG: sigma-70 family RNA polymerase sigma factor [Bacteroidota bacterium]
MARPFYTDEVILAGILEGGRQRHRFETILYQQFMYIAWKKGKSFRFTEEELGDLYTDSIVSLIRQIVTERFRGDSSIHTYLSKVFYNKCIDKVRKGSSIETDSLEDWVQIPDYATHFLKRILQKEEWNFVQGLMHKLGARCQQILMMSSAGYKTSEIAQEMGFTSGESAASQKYQCRKKLIEMYSKRVNQQIEG